MRLDLVGHFAADALDGEKVLRLGGVFLDLNWPLRNRPSDAELDQPRIHTRHGFFQGEIKVCGTLRSFEGVVPMR